MPTVYTNGIKTHYDAVGEGPPIVFIHGITMDRQLWRPVMDRLRDQYRCIAYDVRGHGRTGGSDKVEYSVDLFVEDLAALIEKLELEDPVVCGLSMGGMITQEYAATYGENMRAAVVSGTLTPEISGKNHFAVLKILRTITLLYSLFGYHRVSHAFERAQRFVFGDKAGGDEDKVEEIREEDPPRETEEVVKSYRAVCDYQEGSSALRAITVPMLALVGEHEVGLNKRQWKVLSRRVTDIQTDTVPDAGHLTHADNPDWFADRLRTFLQDLD